MKIQRALVSVSDKTGIVDFARDLSSLGIEIISTGGTAKALKDAGIVVRTIDDLTGFPEIMDGRVKTLHPKVHGGILAVRDNPAHNRQMEENGILPIDMVVVNLYPFEATVAKEGTTLDEAIENIDIGGPAMIRSSAKNHRYVTVVVDPHDYPAIIEEIRKTGNTTLQTRQRLAVKVYSHTASYDSAIEVYLSRTLLDERVLRLRFGQGRALRYGENSHQGAAFYPASGLGEACLANAEILHGKELSYNNFVDAEAALEAVKDLAGVPAACVVKHTNPCGFATGASLRSALEAAWQGDPVSAYGSIIALSTKVDLEAAEFLKGRFVEVLIAPGFDDKALDFLRKKSADIRILRVPSLDGGKPVQKTMYRGLVGGMLEQDRDLILAAKWETVTKALFPDEKRRLAEFAWKACKHTKSNAIVLAREYAPGCFQVIGMGAGQPNRLDSVRKLAATKARDNLEILHRESGSSVALDEFVKQQFANMVLASDAFFPFSDSVEAASGVGVAYIVQPGGSKRDQEVVDACDRLGIAMVFTGTRHFRH